LVAVARGEPRVAHVNPFPRAGLMLREQRQQIRRGERHPDLLARLLLRDNYRPDEALGSLADGVAVNHPREDLAFGRFIDIGADRSGVSPTKAATLTA
jgi:hypothetical protein